jgi:release factor glutamine methyltransferase
MSDAFTRKGLDSPRLMAELLLSHVIGCDRLRLYMEADRPASPLERNALRRLVTQALAHEPVQYLVGQAWFHGLPYHVDRRVLIPRPATETIVEHVLRHARAEPAFAHTAMIADICTGSGCIAVALLKGMPHARAVATDISPDALEVARTNAGRHGVTDRIDLLPGDLLAALDSHPVARAKSSTHYLVSNPPYIPDHEWPAVAPNVKDHEPSIALRGGLDGLDHVRRIIEAAPAYLRPGGLLLVEVADSTAEAAAALARARPDLEHILVLKDFEGLPRVVVGRRP